MREISMQTMKRLWNPIRGKQRMEDGVKSAVIMALQGDENKRIMGIFPANT